MAEQYVVPNFDSPAPPPPVNNQFPPPPELRPAFPPAPPPIPSAVPKSDNTDLRSVQDKELEESNNTSKKAGKLAGSAKSNKKRANNKLKPADQENDKDVESDRKSLKGANESTTKKDACIIVMIIIVVILLCTAVVATIGYVTKFTFDLDHS